MQTPSPHAVLRGHTSEVTAAAFGWRDSSGLPTLLSASADGELRLWSMQTHRSLAVKAAHPGKAVHALAGERLLSQGRDGFVRLWDMKGGAVNGPLLQLPSECYNFCQCACSTVLVQSTETFTVSSGNGSEAVPTCGTSPLLAMPNEDANRLHVWDVRCANAPALRLAPSEVEGRAGMCMCARFSTSDVTLVSGWEDGSLQVFDMRIAGRVASSRRLHKEPLLSLDFGPNGGHVLSGSADCALCVLPLVGGLLGESVTKLPIPVTNESSGSGGVAAVRVRPDGQVFAAGGWDRRVRLWQWRKLKPLAVLQHHTATVNSVSFSPCSRYLASASGDQTIAIWTLFPPKTTSSPAD
jgi:WD40 repeat protein